MNIRITISNDPRRRFRFISEPLERGGHDVAFVDVRYLKPFLRDLSTLCKRALRPDVIVSLGFGPKNLVVFCVARLLMIPFVVRIGGDTGKDARSVARSAWACRNPAIWARAVVYLLTERIMMAEVRDIVVVSAYLEEQIHSRLRDDARIAIIPQYCRGEVVRHGRDLAQIPILLTVTSLNYRAKADGVTWMIERLAEFATEANHSFVFRIAGGGLHLKDVERHLQQAQLPPELQVQLLGFVEDIDTQYREADVFLYRSDHDASSNVLLEAKRWGLPVLVNDFPAFRTIVSDGVSGLLYKDNADFKSSLHRLLSNKALRQSLVENGYREHEEVFTIEASRERLEAALSKAIRAQSVRLQTHR